MCAGLPKGTGLMNSFSRKDPSPSPRPGTLGSRFREVVRAGLASGGLLQARHFFIGQTGLERREHCPAEPFWAQDTWPGSLLLGLPASCPATHVLQVPWSFSF